MLSCIKTIFQTVCHTKRLVVIGAALCAVSIASAQPLAKDQDKFLGCGTGSTIWRYLEQYWNQVTPGNDGKWGSVELSRGNYYWTNLDKLYAYATKRNILYKHHTLVWGNQQPGWIGSLTQTEQRKAVEEWIKAVGERYPAITFVDVVNEPIHAPPEYKAALGGDGSTGWNWVITSFQLARQYCAPGVKLLLNEYNVLHSNDETTNYLNIINLLKDRGLIDGIGIQGHYFEFRSHTDAATGNYVYNINTIKANLDRLAATGLPIYITEFDIDEANDANQLAQYKIYFPIFWSHPAVKGITFWGYIQNDVWTSHPTTYLILTNGTERPALQWLRTYLVSPPVPTTLSPIGTSGGLRNPLLIWRAAKTATSYRVQISTSSLFTAATMDTTVADTSFRTPLLAANSRFFWRVSAINDRGTSEYCTAVGFMTGELISSVATAQNTPDDFKLLQNYPNPFNPVTTITFSLDGESMVELTVNDLLGRIIATPVHERMAAGTHTVTFDARRLKSGHYFYTLQKDGTRITRMMTLVR